MSAPEIPNLLSMRGGPRSRRGGRGGSSSLQEGFRSNVEEADAKKDRLVQQTDSDASLSRFSAVNLGYLDDKFVSQFIVGGPPPRRQPIINRGTYVRTIAIDKLVQNFIISNAGMTKQIVSLGAGTDTRYWRLREKCMHLQLLYHEIDFPSVSAQKFAAMRSSAILSPVGSSFSVLHGHAEPQIGPDKARWGFFRDGAIQREGYLFHPLDLRNAPFRVEGLLPDVPTLLISECCLCYLSVGGAQSVIRTFTDAIPTLGIILYEPTKPNDAFGQTMFANLAARGLYMPTVHEYPTLASQYARLSYAGFHLHTGADINWLWQNWVGEEEKERVSRLEMLDELEEWELLAAHYTVVWAWRGENLFPGAFTRWRDWCSGERPFPDVIPREDEVMQSIEA